MKVLGILPGLALIVSAVTALQLPVVPNLSGFRSPDLTKGSVFENGQRCKAGCGPGDKLSRLLGLLRGWWCETNYPSFPLRRGDLESGGPDPDSK